MKSLKHRHDHRLEIIFSEAAFGKQKWISVPPGHWRVSREPRTRKSTKRKSYPYRGQCEDPADSLWYTSPLRPTSANCQLPKYLFHFQRSFLPEFNTLIVNTDGMMILFDVMSLVTNISGKMAVEGIRYLIKNNPNLPERMTMLTLVIMSLVDLCLETYLQSNGKREINKGHTSGSMAVRSASICSHVKIRS